MSTKLRLFLTIAAFFLSFSSQAQQIPDFWQQDREGGPVRSASGAVLSLAQTGVFRLEEAPVREALRPLQTGERAEVVLYFPERGGGRMAYRVVERPVMAPQLQERYPEIRSYLGVSVTDPSRRIRFSMSPDGFQAMVRDGERTVFIEKVPDTPNRYALFSDQDKEVVPSAWKCTTEALAAKAPAPETTAAKLADDQLLRTYRLAVAASGEYTDYHGGTVAEALAAINATLTRINEVFERDLAIRMELISTTDQVIFTDPSTDPFGGNLSAEVQNTLDTRIGPAAYDIGHLFHQGGEAGNAGSIGAVCVDGRKGSAYAATPTPEGDRFDLDFVAHEMGHQFGANHTWSFDTEGTGVQAEPASGTTIMGYAGIVPGDNVALNGDDYFHYYSVQQIGSYVAGASCGSQTALTNVPPVVTPQPDYLIPQGTAFVLEAAATDPDVTNVLTYAWEQIDNGVVTTGTFGPENPAGANFRSLPPSLSPRRYFPALQQVAAGDLTQTNPSTGSAWETLSEVERDFNFAVTVRDNAPGGGQTGADLVKVSVLAAAGPFRVVSQQSAQTYAAGSIQSVTWDVAGTRDGPINAQQVDIFLSLDGGQSFTIPLVSGVPNSGSAQVQLPGNATTQGRLMVKATNNIFFAVNAADFTITEAPFVLEAAKLEAASCQPSDAVFSFNYQSFSGFAETVDLSIANLPAGLTAVFTPAQVQASDTPVTLTLSGTAGVAPGTYTLALEATAPGSSFGLPLELQLAAGTLPAPSLLLPTDGSTGVSYRPQLQWTAPSGADSYEIQLATDPGFSTIFFEGEVYEPRYVPDALDADTVYYWRVKVINACGEGAFGSAFTFRTISTECRTLAAQGLPAVISTTGTPTVTSSVTFADNLVVSDARVILDIDHSYLSDLVVTLRSPAGTEITLFANSCAEANDVNATFQQDAPPYLCGNNPAISGVVRPLGSLNSFAGESSFGEWVLTIRDTAPADGGQLNGFSLELCVEGAFRPDADGDGVFDDGDDLCPGTPPGVPVDTNGCQVYRFAQDQFQVELNSESCIGQADGSVNVTASEALAYTYTLTGPGVNQTAAFSTDFSFGGLAQGTYALCIGATDGSIVYEQQCFDVNITSPDPLSVVTDLSADGTRLRLQVDGAPLYRIEWNGTVQEVVSGSYEFAMESGGNALKVEALPACKGSYEESFFYSDQTLAAPNPFSGYLQVFAPDPQQALRLELFNASGVLVLSRVLPAGGQTRQAYLPPLPSGLYLVRLRQGNQVQTLKMFRQ
ncbi:reprolysin-like metallopeptidase [Robiginitalea sediminis]|uniref:reprolysin-like metallopeptidase n=1 Tax=Robiginitalea sediminis TaxID=1982593 RepID=UPI000B4A631F|nr:zinc-dependent metalloprotease family protein [Robiginitalea sediminis]